MKSASEIVTHESSLSAERLLSMYRHSFFFVLISIQGKMMSRYLAMRNTKTCVIW